MAFLRLGSEFCWRDPPIIFKRALFHLSRHRLLYQVDKGRAIEEHDSQGSYKFCVGAFCIPVWVVTDIDHGPGSCFQVSPIKEFATSLKVK
jgi:hypothetical protein